MKYGALRYNVCLHMNLLTFTLAHSYAFTPRVLRFVIDSISTLPKPSTTTGTATGFPGRGSAAFCALGRNHTRLRCCDGCCVTRARYDKTLSATDTGSTPATYTMLNTVAQRKQLKMEVLTFVLAHPSTFSPSMTEFTASLIRALPVPSTTEAAASRFAGLVSATFETFTGSGAK